MWRQWVFGAGLLVVWVAIASPLAPLAEDLQTAHMVQHVLLGDIAAVLLVLGLTGPMLQPLLAAPGLRHLRVLAHPGVALAYPVVHALEHASFLVAGIGIWAAVLGPLPKPAWFSGVWQLVYVLVMRVAGGLLANLLIWSSTVFYPSYETSAAQRGVTPLTDQNLSGARQARCSQRTRRLAATATGTPRPRSVEEAVNRELRHNCISNPRRRRGRRWAALTVVMLAVVALIALVPAGML